MSNRTRKCSIDGCGRKHKARGWCQTHYRNWRKYGYPVSKRTWYRTPEEAFKNRTKRQGECLVWTGYRRNGGTGYGLIRVDGKAIHAHTFIWEKKNGKIPDDLVLDHICHNKACVETEHLRLATHAQNLANRPGALPDTQSGKRNVYKNTQGWLVKVVKDYVPHYFGTYEDIEEAAQVAEQARKDLFGEFAGKG